MVLSLSFHYHLIFSRYCLLNNFLLFHLKDAFVPDFNISNIIANIAEQDKEVEGIYHKHFFYINPLVMNGRFLYMPRDGFRRRQWQPTLAWKILWMEEPGRLKSLGSLRVRHD